MYMISSPTEVVVDQHQVRARDANFLNGSAIAASHLFNRGKIGVRAAHEDADAFVLGRSIRATEQCRQRRRPARYCDDTQFLPETTLRIADRIIIHQNDMVD